MADEEHALAELVAAAVEAAKRLYGEPEYRYYKQQVTWNARSKSHFVPVAPITREEWEKNSAEAAANEMARFMGKPKQSYWRYERKQVGPAWRERLISLLPQYPS